MTLMKIKNIPNIELLTKKIRSWRVKKKKKIQTTKFKRNSRIKSSVKMHKFNNRTKKMKINIHDNNKCATKRRCHQWMYFQMTKMTPAITNKEIHLNDIL